MEPHRCRWSGVTAQHAELLNGIMTVQEHIKTGKKDSFMTMATACLHFYEEYNKIAASLVESTEGEILKHPPTANQLKTDDQGKPFYSFQYNGTDNLEDLKSVVFEDMELVNLTLLELYYNGLKLLCELMEKGKKKQKKHYADLIEELKESKRLMAQEQLRTTVAVQVLEDRLDDLNAKLVTLKSEKDLSLTVAPENWQDFASQGVDKYFEALAEVQNRLLFTLRDQFFFIHAELGILTPSNPSVSSPTLLQQKLLAGNSELLYHWFVARIGDHPDPHIWQIPSIIKELRIGVRLVRAELEDTYETMVAYHNRCIDAGYLGGRTKAELRGRMAKIAAMKEAQMLEVEAFDLRIAADDDALRFYTNEIIKVARHGVGITRPQLKLCCGTKRQKLVKDMARLENRKCELVGCGCVEKERKLNAEGNAFGTRVIMKEDSDKAEGVINGDGSFVTNRIQFGKLMKEIVLWNKNDPEAGGMEDFKNTTPEPASTECVGRLNFGWLVMLQYLKCAA